MGARILFIASYHCTALSLLSLFDCLSALPGCLVVLSMGTKPTHTVSGLQHFIPFIDYETISIRISWINEKKSSFNGSNDLWGFTHVMFQNTSSYTISTLLLYKDIHTYIYCIKILLQSCDLLQFITIYFNKHFWQIFSQKKSL